MTAKELKEQEAHEALERLRAECWADDPFLVRPRPPQSDQTAFLSALAADVETDQ